MFSVNTAVASGFLGAYAERLGDSSHERIWYFPTATSEAPRVSPGEGTVILTEGVRVGPEHRPGDYRVTVWLSEQPLMREQVGATLNRESTVATLSLKIVP
jgi:hypothetical protein